MDGINRCFLLGNLAQDAELRHAGQTPVLNIRMATNERYKAQDGEWKDRAEYHSVVLWGARATALASFLVKGKPVLVEGRLQTRMNEKDGVKRYFTEVNATNIVLLNSGDKRDGQNAAKNERAANAPDNEYGDDSDIPF